MGKDRKPVPEDLELADKLRLSNWVLRKKAEYGWFDWIRTPKDLRPIVDECLAYHDARGNPKGYTNWYAVCRRWLVNTQQFKERDRQAGKRESFVNLDGPVRLRVVK